MLWLLNATHATRMKIREFDKNWARFAKMVCNRLILHSRIIVFIVVHFVYLLCVCDAGDRRSFVIAKLC